jgi:hypothetical protein
MEVTGVGYNQGVEYSDAITDTMLSAPRQAVLLAGCAAFGSTDRMSTQKGRWPDPIVRVLSKIERRGDDECWPYHGKRHPEGHAQVWYQGKKWYAHRLVYTLLVGPIPDGMVACHRCDNPPCMNPAHLFFGTIADNNADKVAKGRHEKGATHHEVRVPYSVVVDARRRVASGERQRDVARSIGVAETTVGAWVSGRSRRYGS